MKHFLVLAIALFASFSSLSAQSAGERVRVNDDKDQNGKTIPLIVSLSVNTPTKTPTGTVVWGGTATFTKTITPDGVYILNTFTPTVTPTPTGTVSWGGTATFTPTPTNITVNTSLSLTPSIGVNTFSARAVTAYIAATDGTQVGANAVTALGYTGTRSGFFSLSSIMFNPSDSGNGVTIVSPSNQLPVGGSILLEAVTLLRAIATNTVPAP
jgi:hypothetical protein